MARPTEILLSYLAARTEMSEMDLRRMLRTGRISLAMEIITVQRILEEHELLAENEAMIACLQALLQDQGLAEVAAQWYDFLAEWRRIKFYDAVSDSIPTDAELSEHEVPPDAEPPLGSNGAQPGNDQTMDPPSSD